MSEKKLPPKNWNLVKSVRKMCGQFAHCPVTGNRPTRMTRAGFERACAASMSTNGNEYCQKKCKGKQLPDNLEFIGLDELQGIAAGMVQLQDITVIKRDVAGTAGKKKTATKETVMVKKNNKQQCNLCNEPRSLKKHLDKEVCSTCAIILSGAKNNPESLQRALGMYGHATQEETITLSAEAKSVAADNSRSSEGLLSRIEMLEKKLESINLVEAAFKNVISKMGVEA